MVCRLEAGVTKGSSTLTATIQPIQASS